jgi:hypothetical protein
MTSWIEPRRQLAAAVLIFAAIRAGADAGPPTESDCDCTRLIGVCSSSGRVVSQVIHPPNPITGHPREAHWTVELTGPPHKCALVRGAVKPLVGANADSSLGISSVYERTVVGSAQIVDYQRTRVAALQIEYEGSLNQCRLCSLKSDPPGPQSPYAVGSPYSTGDRLTTPSKEVERVSGDDPSRSGARQAGAARCSGVDIAVRQVVNSCPTPDASSSCQTARAGVDCMRRVEILGAGCPGVESARELRRQLERLARQVCAH